MLVLWQCPCPGPLLSATSVRVWGGGVDWRGEGAADFSQYEMRPGLRLVSVLLVPHQISLYLNLSTNYLVCSEDAFFSKHSFLSAVLKH